MAWTPAKMAILNEAARRWLAGEGFATLPYPYATIAIATLAQKRAALQPYIAQIKAEYEAKKTNLTNQDTELATQIQDAIDAATELG